MGLKNVDQRSNDDRQNQVITPMDVSSLSQPRGSDEDMDRLNGAILTARSRWDLVLIIVPEAKFNPIRL